MSTIDMYFYTNAKFIVICKPRTLNDGGEDSVKYRNRKKHRFLAAVIFASYRENYYNLIVSLSPFGSSLS